jgi:ribosomal protein L18E
MSIQQMTTYLIQQNHDIARDILEALEAARIMRESVSVVRIVGKSIVEVKDEEAFIRAAKQFSDVTQVWNKVSFEESPS